MRKHLQSRLRISSEEIKESIEKLATKMENLSSEELCSLFRDQSREVSEGEYMISRIDALQAELYRRENEQKSF